MIKNVSGGRNKKKKIISKRINLKNRNSQLIVQRILSSMTCREVIRRFLRCSRIPTCNDKCVLGILTSVNRCFSYLFFSVDFRFFTNVTNANLCKSENSNIFKVTTSKYLKRMRLSDKVQGNIASIKVRYQLR